MYSDEKPGKPSANAVSHGVKNKTVMDKLWKDLNLQYNEILNVYTLLNEYQDVFTNKNCHLGKTSWDTFKIELLPNLRPIRQEN